MIPSLLYGKEKISLTNNPTFKQTIKRINTGINVF